jgi:outer membrane murein-binding lipoprotein Lpp
LSHVCKNNVAKSKISPVGSLWFPLRATNWVIPIHFKIRKVQMKKVLVAALVIAGLAFSGCSKKAKEEANTTAEANTTVEANTTAPVEANATAPVEANATEANKTH